MKAIGTSKRRMWPAVLVLLTLTGVACSEASTPGTAAPARIEEAGPDLWRVILTEQGAERTGLEITEVLTSQIDGAERLVVPYSAVMYHYDGSTWTYTNPEDLTFVRESITIDYVDGDVAVLLEGPDVGAMVVSVGAAELYGVEFGIGK